MLVNSVVSFLNELEGTVWQLPKNVSVSFEPDELFVQKDVHLGLQVAVARAEKKPSVSDMRSVWDAREGKRGFPLLLVVLYTEGGVGKVAVAGPTGENPKVIFELDPLYVERTCRAALKRPDRSSILSFFAQADIEERAELPGIRNQGLFALQELMVGVPDRSDWKDACEVSTPLLDLQGQELFKELGYTIENIGGNANFLISSQSKNAVAVFLQEEEGFEESTERFVNISPVAHALSIAENENLDWVVLIRGSTLRLYPTSSDVGVGRRGRSSTFLEVNLELLRQEQSGYLDLIFGPVALGKKGTVSEILETSEIYVASLGERLRDRIYFDAVPVLARVLAESIPKKNTADLDFIYSQTMQVLFRILFIAYGEDKGLLPYRLNESYAKHSLNELSKELTQHSVSGASFDEKGTDLWDSVNAIWIAIEFGRSDWNVPPYGGTLFSSDDSVNPEGAALKEYKLTNTEFGPFLAALLVDKSKDEIIGPIDFRSLSVREFGTIYEGLLESKLSLAEENLSERKNGQLAPSGAEEEIDIRKGEIYFHNQSGSRKSSGSYFTKPFAVEHLLRHALKPALNEHLAEVRTILEKGDEASASKKLLDFRCADISMGSGHFLVAAVDHIESAITSFLQENPISSFSKELNALKKAAINSLGELAPSYQIDEVQLLRRLISRRCIFGCDLNPVSVELARLAVWVHTFVPGLPLSFLDHNLVYGNSLTGIAEIESFQKDANDLDFIPGIVSKSLEKAKPHLDRLAAVNDATIKDIEEVRIATEKARAELSITEKLLDLLMLSKGGLLDLEPLFLSDDEYILKQHAKPEVQEGIDFLKPVHFPTKFPELFSGGRGGFNCILGNPPWEEIKTEERSFWARYYPGLWSMGASGIKKTIEELKEKNPSLLEEYEKELDQNITYVKVLSGGDYPGFETGDPDLYKAFSWRFWNLLRDGGTFGVVLPRSVLASSGSSLWRKHVIESGDFIECTQLLNNRNWVFEDVHPQYTIVLLSVKKTGLPDDVIAMRGPFNSKDDYLKGVDQDPVELPASGILSWTEGASFPLVPSRESGEVFLKLRKHPNLIDVFGCRPIREFDATNDRKKSFFSVDFEDEPKGSWPVFKGSSFNLWNSDTGERYGWCDPTVVVEELQRRRVSGQRKRASAFYEADDEWVKDEKTLNCFHPRIAFRGITNRTNSRTVIAALVPPELVLTNASPYLHFPVRSAHSEAYILGVLSSTILDWFARRVVEVNLNFFIFDNLPVPEVAETDSLFKRVTDISGRLSAVDERYKSWAKEVGVPAGSVKTQSEKEDLIAELDAVVAHLYGLNEGDLEVIWDTFHTTVDHLPDLEKVLDHYRKWKK